MQHGSCRLLNVAWENCQSQNRARPPKIWSIPKIDIACATRLGSPFPGAQIIWYCYHLESWKWNCSTTSTSCGCEMMNGGKIAGLRLCGNDWLSIPQASIDLPSLQPNKHSSLSYHLFERADLLIAWSTLAVDLGRPPYLVASQSSPIVGLVSPPSYTGPSGWWHCYQTQ